MKTDRRNSPAYVATEMLMPFVHAMEMRDSDVGAALEMAGIRDGMLKEKFIPARLGHQFLNAAADQIGDPHLGYHIGSLTPFPELPNLRRLPGGKHTLGDLLTTLVIDAPRLTNQARYEFKVSDTRAILVQRRRFRPLNPTVQGDGMFVGFILRLIRECLGNDLANEQMTIRLSSRRAIPSNELPESVLVESDKGVLFAMPPGWTLKERGGRSISDLDRVKPYYPSTRQAVASYLKGNYSDPNLEIDSVAQALGKSVRMLQIELAAENTNFRDELRRVRMEEAERFLKSDNTTINDVALKSGYRSVPGFIRAFKSWSGQSPAAYRDSIRN